MSLPKADLDDLKRAKALLENPGIAEDDGGVIRF